MSEISQEAKTALANVSRQKALRRLDHDGASSIDAVRRRLRWVAQDRNLPPEEVAKVMKTRRLKDVGAFCEKHGLSADWLMFGDLKKHPKSQPARQGMSQEEWSEFIGLVGKINPRRLAEVLAYMRMLANGGA